MELAERWSGAREERRLAGTEVSTPGETSWCLDGARGAGRGSYVAAAGVPSLATPSLEDAVADELDAPALRHILAARISQLGMVKERKRKEEEKEKAEVKAKRAEELTESMLALARDASSSSSSGKRRKRRKRSLPRTSPHSSRGRARRRQRQCYVRGWFCCFSSSLAVSPSFVGMPELPDTMVGMDVMDSFMCYAGFAAGDAPRVVFPSVGQPRMLRIMDGMDQKDTTSSCARRRLRQWHLQGWFFLVLHLALCSFLLSSGQRCLSSWPVWSRRNVTWRRGHRSAETCRLSTVAAHQGRRFPRRSAVADFHGPACLDDEILQLVLNTVIHVLAVQVVQVSQVVDFIVVVQRPIPMVLPVKQIIEIPQFLLYKVVDVRVTVAAR